MPYSVSFSVGKIIKNSHSMLIKTVIQALEKMDKRFVRLSKIGLDPPYPEKYLERPFAYEFYHQLRKMMENDPKILGGYFVQAEVDKSYQHYFESGKIPDFIIHLPDSKENLAVIEFKTAIMAIKGNEIEKDFKKLHDFRSVPELSYKHAIEVIIGNEEEIKRVDKRIKEMGSNDVEGVEIIYFNTDKWKASSA